MTQAAVAIRDRQLGGDAYLRLILSDRHTALVPMVDVQQVMVVPPTQLTVMPNMPALVMGLLNYRNRVVWVIDLGQLLGLEPLSCDCPYYTVALLRLPEKWLGIAISDVRGILRLGAGSLQSPVGTVSAALVPYLKGCCLVESEMLLVLDATAIATAPLNSAPLNSVTVTPVDVG